MEYEYARIESYGGTTDIRRYTRKPMGGRRPRVISSGDVQSHIPQNRQNDGQQIQREKIRSQANARSAAMAFRKLVAANLYRSNAPILATFTYTENMGDIGRAKKDLNAFEKRFKAQFGVTVRYIITAEYQERGAVHFHALIWGLHPSIVKRERSTRLFAGFWGKGFVDLKKTDGNIRLAGYLAKYFRDTFADKRLAGRKAYVASKNVQRPIIVKDAILAAHFLGMSQPDLSTAHLAQEQDYDTVWLGRCLYQKYLTFETHHGPRS